MGKIISENQRKPSNRRKLTVTDSEIDFQKHTDKKVRKQAVIASEPAKFKMKEVTRSDCNRNETSSKLDKDVTSESETSTFKNSVSSIEDSIENQDIKRFRGSEHSVFVGNLPSVTKKSMIKQIFKPFGKILSVRFRTLDGEILFKKKRKMAKALNCYVRFETKDEAQAACAMNGHLFEGHHLRVSLQSQKQLGHHASTVFIGNIHRDTTDNELHEFFSKVGDIEYVRQISGKYIGYVCFKKGVSIAKALKLNQQLLNGRPLRVMKIDQRQQNTRKNKKGNLVKNKSTFHNDAKSFKSVANLSERNLLKDNDFHGALAKPHSNLKRKSKTIAERNRKLLALKLTAVGNMKKKKPQIG